MSVMVNSSQDKTKQSDIKTHVHGEAFATSVVLHGS